MKQKHVLIIEDESLIAYDIQKKVSKDGYATTIATN